MFWHSNVSYEFGPFRLDTRERRLLRDGEVVPLTPKVFDTLLVLVRNQGHILTKDEILSLVWADTLVEEGNVSRNISTLRKALGDVSSESHYIETVPWRGYRFVAGVKEFQQKSSDAPIVSLAVLPFVNVKAEPETDYLAEGITERVIYRLGRLTNLKVTSRNSSFRYKGCDIDARSVGRELNVQTVLMGRVSESDDQLSVSVELVDAHENSHLWGAQYIRPAADLSEIHETIAREITEKLQLSRADRELQQLAHRHSPGSKTYVLFLKGRYHFNKLNLDGVQKGIEYFLRAIEREPDYALAYAGLADCYNYLSNRDEAKKAVLMALKLDEQLGEAHASLGFFRFVYDWDFTGAEAEFKRALALTPNYAEAHHWYAIYLANMGRHQEADQYASRAIELDPLSLMMNITPALNYYLAREYDHAIEQLQKVIEMEPNFVAARSTMGNVLVQKGFYEEALAEYTKVLELIKGASAIEPSVKAIMAYAYARWNRREEAEELLAEVSRAVAAGIALPYSVAAIYCALGETDSAFEWLEKAYLQHDLQFVSLKRDPALEGLRSDPRFAELSRRMNF